MPDPRSENSNAPAGGQRGFCPGAVPPRGSGSSGATTQVHDAVRFAPFSCGELAGEVPALANKGHVTSSMVPVLRRPEDIQPGLFKTSGTAPSGRVGIHFAPDQLRERLAGGAAPPLATTLVSDNVILASSNPGDNIPLPDIPTDSDSSDDAENEPVVNWETPTKPREVPSWTTPTELRKALEAQGGKVPDNIPGGPINMEEVFGTNGRRPSLLVRTSSANWAGDEITADDITIESAARTKLMKDGTWSYELIQDLH